jgi:hypothetical protein
VKARLFVALVFAACSIAVQGQLAANYYLEKPTFAPGEPVFVYLKLSNTGPVAVRSPGFDPELPMCSGNSIKLSRVPPSGPSCLTLFETTCTIEGHLPAGSVLLGPGEATVERYLLNSPFELGAPGNYLVEAGHREGRNPTVLPMRVELRFRVEENASLSVAELQPWIDQLGSDDLQRRREAARVLASAASPALEETLLWFAKNPEFQLYAPLALHRLNSPRSLQAMADLPSSEPSTPDAARYLAETGDQKWYPVLLNASVKNGKIVSDPDYAAELGGAKMLPVLVSLERNPDSRLQAVMAMGLTGSREAIPILIGLLKHPDPEISWQAYYSLYELTHRSDPLESQDNFHADAQYAKWSEWWNRDGATAPIYKPTHCLVRPTEP